MNLNLITTFLATAIVIFAFGQAIAQSAPRTDTPAAVVATHTR